MSIVVSQKNWKDETYRAAILGVAQVLKEEIEIELPKQKFKPYNAQIWKDDNIILEKDFMKKPQAMKWIKKVLAMRKCKDAYADLKKYNKKNDDFDYWFFKMENDKVIETLDI